MAGVNATGTLALIVEDDPATRALEEAVFLEDDGFAVLTAKNGEEGIRLAYERRLGPQPCSERGSNNRRSNWFVSSSPRTMRRRSTDTSERASRTRPPRWSASVNSSGDGA
jgi:hypothetical protein